MSFDARWRRRRWASRAAPSEQGVGPAFLVLEAPDPAAALLTYRAAWKADQALPTTREVAMAKLVATESAQEVIDAAVQIFGGLGVVSDMPVEKLYREIRALRIYEGASEVQLLIVAREILKSATAKES